MNSIEKKRKLEELNNGPLMFEITSKDCLPKQFFLSAKLTFTLTGIMVETTIPDLDECAIETILYDKLYDKLAIDRIIPVHQTHYVISQEHQMAILADINCRRIYLRDTYIDTREFSLLKREFWLVIRNNVEYRFKNENNKDYCSEIKGPVKDLPRWMFSRFLFDLKIVRCFQSPDDKAWIDFVIIENGSGHKLFDCVGTVCGLHTDLPHFGPKRCSTPFVAAKVFYTDNIKDQTLVAAPCDWQDFWPEWHSPIPYLTITAEERAAALDYSMMIRDEELASK